MVTLESISVDEDDTTTWLMVAITYKEIEDLTQAENSAVYRFFSS